MSVLGCHTLWYPNVGRREKTCLLRARRAVTAKIDENRRRLQRLREEDTEEESKGRVERSNQDSQEWVRKMQHDIVCTISLAPHLRQVV